MRRGLALGLAATLVAGASTLALAQNQPENILPPGFDQPAPTPTPTPRRDPRPAPSPAPAPAAPAGQTTTASGQVLRPGEIVQALPAGSTARGEAAPVGSGIDLARLPTLEQLSAMSTDELDELFGLKPKVDIPPAAQRGLSQVGILGPDEGGMPLYSLGNQPADLVRAALVGNKGTLVSRWGHILLRRALASRLAAPAGMDPVEFVSLRAGLLNRMNEFVVARSLVQDVDTANYSPALTDAAFAAYLGAGDVLGTCPAIRLSKGTREDAEWRMTAAICNAYAGETSNAQNDLRRLRNSGKAPRIDVLLAQRYAGAAGDGSRAVTIEWDKVEELTPWRFALANAVGAEIPASLTANPSAYFAAAGAISPLLAPEARIAGAQVAARRGILSSQAMVDLYSALAEEQGSGPGVDTAQALRSCYLGPNPAARMEAMRTVWGAQEQGAYDYARLVLTAAAAARIEPSSELAADAGPLIASMLSAGYNRDAARWAGVVGTEGQGWALLAVASPQGATATGGQFGDFADEDGSERQQKSRMLLAGLAGLGRVSDATIRENGGELGLDLTRRSRWTLAIDSAAQGRNQVLVALLAGLGMQGDRWGQMTPVHLYHIVRALNTVGLGAEARMIAAEAVARA